MSKLWVNDRMYVVDEEVRDYVDNLQSELEQLKESYAEWKTMALALKTKYDEHRWIPVSERLPETKQYYLATAMRLSNTFVLWWTGKFWRLSENNPNCIITEVTHWKPIILPSE